MIFRIRKNKTHLHYHGSNKGGMVMTTERRVVFLVALSKTTMTTRLRATCFGPTPTVPTVIVISFRQCACGGSFRGFTYYLTNRERAPAVHFVAKSVSINLVCRYVLCIYVVVVVRVPLFITYRFAFKSYAHILTYFFNLLFVKDFEAPDDELCFCYNKDASLCGDNTNCIPDDNDNQDVGTCRCKEGYDGDPVLLTSPNNGCTDINECDLADVCGPNGVCANLVGSFRCDCNEGYFWDSPRGGCKDRNECLLETAPCGPNARCANTAGSFTCICDSGFSGNPPNGEACKDINGALFVCRNLYRSYGRYRC